MTEEHSTKEVTDKEVTDKEVTNKHEAEPTIEPVTATETGPVCYRHPQTETGLRCKKCDRYICPKCANRTPVGYICPECLRAQENRFFTGGVSDYGLAVIIALPLSLLVTFIFSSFVARIGFFALWIAILGAPFAGGIIAEVVRWGVQKRRSRYLGRIVAGCLIVAVILFSILHLLIGNWFGLLILGILLFMGAGAILGPFALT